MSDIPTPRRSSRGKSGTHHCPHCGKGYERPDHLARHLDSRECLYYFGEYVSDEALRSQRENVPMSDLPARV
jgi:hypothetical protein